MHIEFISCYEAKTQAVRLRILFLAIFESISKPLKFFATMPQLCVILRLKIDQAIKKIKIKYLVLRDIIKEDQTIISHIDT